jgi:hypothetical protein
MVLNSYHLCLYLEFYYDKVGSCIVGYDVWGSKIDINLG